MFGYSTLTEAFAASVGSDRALNLIEGADEMTSITRRDLHDRALAVLGVLQERGLRPGDEVVIYLDHNQQFLEAFWACLFGGLIPVPVALGISDEHRFRLLRIFARLDNPTLYSDSRALGRLERLASTNDVGSDLAHIRKRSILVPVQSVPPHQDAAADG